MTWPSWRGYHNVAIMTTLVRLELLTLLCLWTGLGVGLAPYRSMPRPTTAPAFHHTGHSQICTKIRIGP